jgi:hypothetical protein
LAGGADAGGDADNTGVVTAGDGDAMVTAGGGDADDTDLYSGLISASPGKL